MQSHTRDAFKLLLKCVVDYRDYEHDGDPWTEDARVMGEMQIDGLTDEQVEEFKQLAEQPQPRCADCKHWSTPPRDYELGLCSKLNISDHVEIELETGRDGGYVNAIETDRTFYCADFEPCQ